MAVRHYTWLAVRVRVSEELVSPTAAGTRGGAAADVAAEGRAHAVDSTFCMGTSRRGISVSQHFNRQLIEFSDVSIWRIRFLTFY